MDVPSKTEKKKAFNRQLVFITSGENTKVIIRISCLQGYHRFGEEETDEY